MQLTTCSFKDGTLIVDIEIPMLIMIKGACLCDDCGFEGSRMGIHVPLQDAPFLACPCGLQYPCIVNSMPHVLRK